MPRDRSRTQHASIVSLSHFALYGDGGSCVGSRPMRKFGSLIIAAGLASFAVGCGTDGTPATASAVFPSSAFIGRKLRVEIVGDATSFKDGASVSFGDGVTVGTVAV